MICWAFENADLIKAASAGVLILALSAWPEW